MKTDQISDLKHSSCKVLACATVIEEMIPLLPDDLPYEVLDFGLHLNPAELKRVLQEKIIEASKEADVLLLGYGLCSMAVVGLKATTATLVIPRTDDCIAIFLGSAGEYKKQAKAEPGTYYLTKGWIEAGDTPFEEYQEMIERFGEEKARRMTRLLLKNYKRLALINTGQYEIERYRDYTQSKAKDFDLRFEEIDGSTALIEKMLHGPWDEDFVVVEPGNVVAYEDFTDKRTNPEG